jgi:pyroglutamyl-peptidase
MTQPRTTPASRNPVLLVTGFGPFENYPENPSGDIAALVHGLQIASVRVVGQHLPVAWREAWPTIQTAVRAHQPLALLCLGVAPDPFIRLEILAKNLALPAGDVLGAKPEAGVWWRIVADAPPAYYTTLPLDWLRERLQHRRNQLVAAGVVGEAVVRAELWPDAGYYLCNHVFFQAMHHLGEEVPYRGFVHVPRYPIGEETEGARREVWASGVFLVEELACWLGERFEERSST